MAPRLIVSIFCAGFVSGLFLAPVGCSSHEDDLIRSEVLRLTLSRGEAATSAANRLTRFGRRSLSTIEAALHTADEPGRRNLVLAIRRLGEAEAIALLLHVAAYDDAESVRREAGWTLQSWAAGTDERATSARAALRRLDELADRQEAG